MVLYRKYRSKSFQEVFGQEPIVKVLRQAVKDRKFAHAYLFSGPRGTGKTSIARILAKALNCLKLQNGEPCNNCKNCQAVNAGHFLDLIEIDAASNRGIDEIRDLKEKVNFLPVAGKFRIYIIDEVHMLTNEAFNALLKTLEEPPSQVVFVLATTEVHKVPLTIISRTQRFDFRLAKPDILEKKLQFILEQEKIVVAADALNLIAESGMGSFRDAETILEKVITSFPQKNKQAIKRAEVEEILGFASVEMAAKFLKALLSRNRSDALQTLEQVNHEGINLGQFIKQLLEEARKQLIRLLETSPRDKNIKILVGVIKEFAQAGYEQKFTLVPILPLEVALVKLTEAPETDNNQDVSEKIKMSESPEIKKAGSITELSGKTHNESAETPQGELNFAGITDRWQELLKGAKKHNHHLVAILTSSKPIGLENNQLTIEVPFAFHKTRISDNETQKILKQMSKSVFGRNFAFKSVINKQLAEKVEKEKFSNEKIVEEIFNDEADKEE